MGATVPAGLEGLPYGKGEVRRRGHTIAILAFGTLLHPALTAAEALGASVANMRWAKPLDLDLLRDMARSHLALVTVEEGCLMGGAGSAVLEALQAEGLILPVLQLGLPDEFIEHGDPAKLLAGVGLDAQGIERAIRARFSDLLPGAPDSKPPPEGQCPREGISRSHGPEFDSAQVSAPQACRRLNGFTVAPCFRGKTPTGGGGGLPYNGPDCRSPPTPHGRE